MRLLVVDDVEAILFATSSYFSALGWTVDTAATELDARALVETRELDVVLTDLRLGGATEAGLELARFVRSSAPNIRVIMVTGAETSDLGARAAAAGIEQVLLKPQRLRDLARLLTRD